MELAVVVGVAFAMAVLAVPVARVAPKASGWVLALVPAGLALWLAQHVPAAAAGGVLVERWAWSPELGVALAFRLDGLSLLFSLLITGIGALVFVYAGGYLKGDARLPRFYATLATFMASMLGLVLADDLIALFVFWELTSITSFLLVGFENRSPVARASALQALVITGGGGLALLTGFILLSIIGGSYSVTELLGAGDEVRAHALYAPMLVLVLLGAFTKSAQWPFHVWLPNAMAAPTPVSAYLHSATMVKAGIYILLRFTPTLAGTQLWTVALTLAGGITMVMAAWFALRERDAKRVLAYSTVSALGTMTLLLGLDVPIAGQAALLVLLSHALYKGALFMAAGAIDHETGTRDLDQLRGLRRSMPVTFVAVALAAAGLAGLAPVLSFLGKELLLEAVLEAPLARPLVVGATLLTGMLLVAVAGIVAIKPFLGEPRPTPRPAHEAPPSLLLGPVVLSVGGLLLGLMPSVVDRWVLPGAVLAVTGMPPETSLVLWHGFTPVLGISAFILVGGVVLYKGWINFHTWPDRVRRIERYGPQAIYTRVMASLIPGAKGLTRQIQHGRLRGYTATLVLVLVGLLAVTFWRGPGLPPAVDSSGMLPHEVAIALVIAAAGVAVVLTRSRLTAVVLLGVVGYGAALIYVLFGAPDLAMTQFLFETLTVLLFALVLPRLPLLTRRSSRLVRARDAVLATFAGLFMAGLVLLATAEAPFEPVSEFFAERSKPDAHGKNVVNVILVDFRALDTLGEITVLAIASIGVYALLHAQRLNLKPAPPVESLIMRTVARTLVPLLLLFSIFLLLRGHNEPGGGFVGGLVAASAFAVYAYSYDITTARRALTIDPRALVALGLLVAIAAALVGPLMGLPLLTGVWGVVDFPVFGPIDLGTPLLFDFGVYLVVWGVALTILFELKEGG